MSVYHGYVYQTLDAESDLLRAIPVVREIASDPRNYVREYDGEDVMTKIGMVPTDIGSSLKLPGSLFPWVRIRLRPPNSVASVSLVYEVRVQRLRDPASKAYGMVAYRVLTITTELVAPVNTPISPAEVAKNRDSYFAQAAPIVRQFFPIHAAVQATIDALDPIPHGEHHTITPVAMRFAAPEDGPDARELPPSVVVFQEDDDA